MPTTLPMRGPYPKGDRKDDLQQLSLTAFRAVLPIELFQFRDERVDDKGVDVVLELKARSQFTNIRAQVQIKATDEEALNTDGSYSFSVDVSNLNYLLNGSSPLYVLWIAPRNELRYAWGRAEAHRLHRENPDWLDQKTITIRFREVLNSESLNSVYDCIMQEGRLHRQTHDGLCQAALAESVTVRINATTLNVVTDQQAYERLIGFGLSMIADGQTVLVLELIGMLPQVKAAESRIRLVTGYALYSQSDYFSARPHLSRARISRDEFSPIDRYVLDALLLHCDYYLGILNKDQRRAGQLLLESESPNLVSLQIKLDRLRYEHIGETDQAKRVLLAKDIRQTAEQLQEDPDSGSALKLQARLTLVFAEAVDGNSNYVDTLSLLRSRSVMGLDPATASLTARLGLSFKN